ncbi:hypothetical protein RchiOBHm_Chr3g0467361 [Rosa chinensis]|uniref:Uncharacterized protein n=1 Tax=Rosa chinensis TaxID=74649 RepID=A0A2P6RA70_ROSCH|nr:hypothetical protein RchiOBHm_Chr3g0467361 [Rosa chinensis]
MDTISLDILIFKGMLQFPKYIICILGANPGLMILPYCQAKLNIKFPFSKEAFRLCLETVECGIFSSQVYYLFAVQILDGFDAYALDEFLSEERKLEFAHASENSNGVINNKAAIGQRLQDSEGIQKA